MEEKTLLGQAIKKQRLSLNMTMEEAASKSGVSRATLWSIEKGTGNCSIDALLSVMETLSLSLSIKGYKTDGSSRDRASRRNTVLDKKINRFVVMCVEQYSSFSGVTSGDVYRKMHETGLIDDLMNDYEDLHGMSMEYLIDYIGASLSGGAA